MLKFSAGERVVVTGVVDTHAKCPFTGIEWDNCWIDQMEPGRTLTVTGDWEIGQGNAELGVHLSDGCRYPWWVLRRADAEPGVFREGDIVTLKVDISNVGDFGLPIIQQMHIQSDAYSHFRVVEDGQLCAGSVRLHPLDTDDLTLDLVCAYRWPTTWVRPVFDTKITPDTSLTAENKRALLKALAPRLQYMRLADDSDRRHALKYSGIIESSRIPGLMFSQAYTYLYRLLTKYLMSRPIPAYTPSWRFDAYDYAAAVERSRRRGKQCAVLVSKLRKYTATGKIDMTLPEIVHEMRESGLWSRSVDGTREYVNGLYVALGQAENSIQGLDPMLTCKHIVKVSEGDYKKIAYIKELRHAVGNSVTWTTTRVGRYIRAVRPDFSDKAIQKIVEVYESVNKPPELYFVENDDPDGWEWVYEHGYGFQSCMTYNRSDRCIHHDLFGERHPVRAYARPGNGLRLAWLGNKEAGKVTARAIVRDDPDYKGYIRIYGDSRIRQALAAAGYTCAVSLDGVELNKKEVALGGTQSIICPYVDGREWLEVYDDHMKVVECRPNSNTPHAYAQNSSGWTCLR